MSLPPPPLSEPVRLNQVGLGVERVLTPDDAARLRIAQMLDMVELSSFEAVLSLKPSSTGWTLGGRVKAQVVQACGLTLEPLPSAIDEAFEIALVEADARSEDDAEIEISLEDDGPDLVEDGVVDLGVYAVEQLALALDPFPRKPGAVFEPPAQPAEASPFAVLKTLKPATRDDT